MKTAVHVATKTPVAKMAALHAAGQATFGNNPQPLCLWFERHTDDEKELNLDGRCASRISSKFSPAPEMKMERAGQ